MGPHWNYNVLLLFTMEESKAEASSGASSCTTKVFETFSKGSFKGCWEVEEKVISYICVTWNNRVLLVILAPEYGHYAEKRRNTSKYV